ncbi:MAG TPA: hypothetical protein ENG87_04575 [Candidatus Pacearchaeota archaeon]|nr:hypothetical protein BMS3Abin17_00826 [archaeon BMS3Abin17]HDK42631.1 hypothetical protein [Candidatus Pacearchaeota archaeon]HDZ60081.1 hypothetical protein [Candidatus Pacearchaeota archaeon]
MIPSNINTKILVYEDRVKEWFLEVGRKLKQDNEAGFIILQVALSYIEGNQQYRKGKSSDRKSKEFFKEGMKQIFPEIIKTENADTLLNMFYKQVRCGLFHDGITGRFVTISGEFLNALEISDIEMKINPHRLLDGIIEDFDNYIILLKDEKNLVLRRNFEVRFETTG